MIAGLEQVAPVLDALPAPAYLVGGAVRDLLLGRRGFDVDLAVVGDAESYAHALATRLGGHVVTHGQFGTAVVHYDGGHVDVATARTETYAAPGALPQVAPASSIEDDLRRRDFTINAMAIALPEQRLIDPYRGEEHLRDRLVRVLHEKSFVDDPTRIFRAARYEMRLGFRMDPKTETLAMLAAPGVGALSGARIREELFAIFDEEDPEASLRRLRGLGVEQALGIRFVDAPLQSRLRELAAAYRLGHPRWHLGLLSVDADESLFDHWKVVRRVAASVAAAHSEAPFLRERIATARDAAAIVDACEAVGPDTPLYLLAREESPPLRMYYERLRAVELELDGDDLAALGLGESPRVGEVLAELRRRKLNGELTSRAAELAAARELIAE